jgi:hypothetical protein
MYEEKKQFYFEGFFFFFHLASCATKFQFINWLYQYLDCMASVIWMNMNMEHWQNGDWQSTQCHFVHHKSYIVLRLNLGICSEKLVTNPLRYHPPLYLVVTSVHWRQPRRRSLPGMWWMCMHKISWQMTSCNYLSWKHSFQDYWTYSRTLLRSLSRDQRIRDSLSGKTY